MAPGLRVSDKQPQKLKKQAEMQHTLGRSPARSHTDSSRFSRHKQLAQGTSTMPSSGVQEAKETNGEEARGPSVQQNNVATVFCSSFSGLVTSPRTTVKRSELAGSPSLYQLSALWLPKHPSITLCRLLPPPTTPSEQSMFSIVQ